MKTMTILRARCIYSKLAAFDVLKHYKFGKYADYASFSVYKPIVGVETGNCYATRLLDECGVLVIEGVREVLAVFEVC